MSQKIKSLFPALLAVLMLVGLVAANSQVEQVEAGIGEDNEDWVENKHSDYRYHREERYSVGFTDVDNWVYWSRPVYGVSTPSRYLDLEVEDGNDSVDRLVYTDSNANTPWDGFLTIVGVKEGNANDDDIKFWSNIKSTTTTVLDSTTQIEETRPTADDINIVALYCNEPILEAYWKATTQDNTDVRFVTAQYREDGTSTWHSMLVTAPHGTDYSLGDEHVMQELSFINDSFKIEEGKTYDVRAVLLDGSGNIEASDTSQIECNAPSPEPTPDPTVTPSPSPTPTPTPDPAYTCDIDITAVNAYSSPHPSYDRWNTDITWDHTFEDIHNFPLDADVEITTWLIDYGGDGTGRTKLESHNGVATGHETDLSGRNDDWWGDFDSAKTYRVTISAETYYGGEKVGECSDTTGTIDWADNYPTS